MNDSDLLEDRLARLANPADDGDWDEVLARADRLRRPGRRRWTRRTAVAFAVAAVAAALAVLPPFGLADRIGGLFGSSTPQGTVECRGSVAVLSFDPAGAVEVRVGDSAVASADSHGGKLGGEPCRRIPTQRGWSIRVRYTWVAEATTLTCRFPGRVFVHMHPTWLQETVDPQGSSVYLVLPRRVQPGPGPRRTIVASASVFRERADSRLAFAPRYCTRS